MKGKIPPPGTARPKVTLVDTGEEFFCLQEESVLHALARLGRRGIPVGCRGGGCGVCKIEVIGGHYDTLVMSRAHVSEAEEAAGKVLACRIKPREDLAIRVIGKLRKAIGCLSVTADSQ